MQQKAGCSRIAGDGSLEAETPKASHNAGHS